MKKSLKFTIETQTENNDVISICHLNEKVIALELSKVARVLYSKNLTLFNKINSSTKLLSGRVYRQEVTKLKSNVNRLMVRINNNYDYNETEICSFVFSNDFLKKQRRIKDPSNRLFDYDPETLVINNSANVFNPQSLTFDDIENSNTISEIQEIFLLQDQGIKTFMLTDFMEDKPGIHQVSYRFEVNVDTKFNEYLNFTMKQLNDSIYFLSKYSKSLELSSRYNYSTLEFTPNFVNSLFLELGIDMSEGAINLGSQRIKTSEFGKAALAFYNASLLLTPDVDKTLYGKILRALLPSSLTSPEAIKDMLLSFSRLYNHINESYDLVTKKYEGKNRSQKIHSNKKSYLRNITSETNAIVIEQEALGYNVFSEKQSGLNSMSSDSYRSRFIQEQLKYYPSIDIEDESSFMTKREKADFSRVDNAPSFLTPANLVLGKKKITTSRGISNINIDDIREFRITKSARASMVGKTNFPLPSKKQSINREVMSDFNLVIGPPKQTLLTRSVEGNIDPLVDAKHYMGSNSFFVTDNPKSLLKTFKNIMSKEDKKIFAIVSDVIPGRFLRQPGSIESIKDFQLSNKKSKFRNLISEDLIELSEIPPQIKSMMSRKFQTNPNLDPLQNKESRAIIDETQKNIFLIKALTGFETGPDGFLDLNRPIEEEMSQASAKGRPLLAKAYNYEVPQLGIVKDKFMPTIYNNLLYVRG